MPKGIAVAKAAFLAKDPGKLEDPLSYRVLLILPALYRRWASIRLRAMDRWVDTWAEPEMFAGIRGRGAADGWYETGIDMEEALAEGKHIVGAAADVHKCFDQIQRQIVYSMAEKAGMPMRVLRAYKSFQELLTARNSVAGHMGHEYPKPTSIPQGDPRSMMVVVLIMKP